MGENYQKLSQLNMKTIQKICPKNNNNNKNI